MANDSSTGEKFFQHDKDLAHQAAKVLNKKYNDPSSNASLKGHDQGYQFGFLDKTEEGILEGQLDKRLESLGTFYTPEGLNDILDNQAAKAESGRQGVAPVIVALVADLNGLKQINDNAGQSGRSSYLFSCYRLKSALRD
jgi:hypothetical protein